MWMVIWYVIAIHQPSPLPPAVNLTRNEAEIIAHAPENWQLGVYGVIKPQAATR